MAKTLIKFSRDWADEFDMEGFVVVDPAKAEEYRQVFSKPQRAYFGTNEGWEDEVLVDAMEFIDISDEQAALLGVLFGSGVGFVPNPAHCESESEDEGYYVLTQTPEEIEAHKRQLAIEDSVDAQWLRDWKNRN